jgi:glycosyltransferase involved in cell wall biosynthesis
MENNQPLVSIVVVSYQQVDFLKECIESILLQTYKNVEIIIADDGSTDQSPDLIRSFAAANSNIIPILSPLNKGISVNLNLGMEQCKGKYICIIAGDDVMYPAKIEKQVAFLEANTGYEMCYHNVDVYDEDTKTILYKWLDEFLPCRHAPDALFRAIWSLKKNNRKAPSGSWFGRSSYLKYARNDWRTYSSHEFIFTMGMYAVKPDAKWHTLPEVLGMYRTHSKGLSKHNPNWQKSVEEISVCYALAKVKFPQFIRAIDNEEAFWWFMHLLYNYVPGEYRRIYMKEFLRKYGLGKYLYLHACRILLSENLKTVRKLVKGSAK